MLLVKTLKSGQYALLRKKGNGTIEVSNVTILHDLVTHEFGCRSYVAG